MLRKAASLRQVAAFLIHWLLVRVQDGPPETADRFRSAARCAFAVCGACSRTRVRSAGSSPPTHHRTTPRNRSAISISRVKPVGACAIGLSEGSQGAKRLPRVRGWWARVIGLNLLQIAVVLLAGVTWERTLAGSSWLHLSESLSPSTAGVVAYVVATFVFYWWHRLRHESDSCWRAFHQIHHSPQRLEVITSFYKHPLEMTANSLIGSALIYSALGLDLNAGAIYTACTALGEFFYHTNVTTPHWVGYFFQRPEMHRIHHEYGKHRGNYGDLVIWDQLFGTYDNPPRFEANCGFDDHPEQQLAAMLQLRDVHR